MHEGEFLLPSWEAEDLRLSVYTAGTGPFPLVVYSHGFGYAYEEISLSHLAENGIAACRFDFCGGSVMSASSGSSLDMSVLTEADDLEAILDYLLKDDRFDSERVYLAGNSQGGYVSVITATRRPDEAAGLFLLSPAFVIADFREVYLDGRIPESGFELMGVPLSSKYISDIGNYSIYEHMKNFRKSVIIYHGTADDLAPIQYSEKAVKYFHNAVLKKFRGAGHMLSAYAGKIEADMITVIRRTGE